MNTYIKSALNQIKAEDELLEKTEKSLRKILEKNKDKLNFDNKRRSVLHMKKFIVAACVAILIIGVSSGAYAFYKTPVAYLSLDINPSVELGVNSFNRIVSVTSYNNDSKTILSGKNIINLKIKDSIKVLVQSAYQNGFIKSDGSTIISLTSETDNAASAQKLEEDAEQGANDAIENGDYTAVVYKDNVALARRDEARKLGITPGKLNLIQKLQALDPTITVDQYKDARVTEIMKKIVEITKERKESTSDIKDIEDVVQQSEKNTDNNNTNLDENNSDNGTVTTYPTDENANKEKGNNSTNLDKNKSDNGTVTTSHADENTNEENGNNSKHKDSNRKGKTPTSSTTSGSDERNDYSNSDNQKDRNHSGSGTVNTTSGTKSITKSQENDKNQKSGSNKTEMDSSTHASTNSSNENNNSD